MSASHDQQSEEAKRFAELINRLFDTHRHPSGREFRISEVSTMTNGQLTVGWLSLSRKGGIARPGADKIALLAGFFGVDTAYFTGVRAAPEPDADETETEAALRQAMANPYVREVAFRASQLDDLEEQRLLLKLVDQALAFGARAREARERKAAETREAYETPGTDATEPDG